MRRFGYAGKSLGKEASGELGNTGVISIDVAGVGNAQGLEGIVGANVALLAIEGGGPGAALSLEGEDAALGIEANGTLAISIVVNNDVALGAIDHHVELVAAIDLLDEDISSSGLVGGGDQVTAIHSAGDVQGLAGLDLDHAELVGGTLSRILHIGQLSSGLFGLNRLLGLEDGLLIHEAFDDVGTGGELGSTDDFHVLDVLD